MRYFRGEVRSLNHPRNNQKFSNYFRDRIATGPGERLKTYCPRGSSSRAAVSSDADRFESFETALERVRAGIRTRRLPEAVFHGIRHPRGAFLTSDDKLTVYRPFARSVTLSSGFSGHAAKISRSAAEYVWRASVFVTDRGCVRPFLFSPLFSFFR